MWQDGLTRLDRGLRQWRGTLLVLMALPLAPGLLAALISGHERIILGHLLGMGGIALAVLALRRGNRPGAAMLAGVATLLIAHLAGGIGGPGSVIFGLMAFAGARMLYAEAPAPEPPPEPPPPLPPDLLAAPRARHAALTGADARLRPAVFAAGELLAELERRDTPQPEARRVLLLQLDGLERMEAALRAGAEPPASLPGLVEEMARASITTRERLRAAETEALEIQAKVLAERLRQEGYA